MRLLTLEEINEIYERAKQKTTVACDGFHPHFASLGCLGGDPQAVDICTLVENLWELRDRIKRAGGGIR